MHSPSASEMPAIQRLALVRQLRAVLERDPRNVDAHVSLAAAYSADKNLADALVHLQKAASLRKKDPEILRRLTNLAIDSKEMATARKYGRRLCEAEPRVANNHRLLGLVHMDMGNPAAALQCFERADRLAPGNVDTINFIGDCHSLKGDHGKAREYFEKVIAIEPTDTPALYNLAHTRKFRPEEVDDYVEKALAAAEQEEDRLGRANMYYAAGKALDDVGRADEAFENFRKGNELRRPAEPEPLIHGFANCANAFTKAYLAGRADWGDPSDRPVFVLGLPRSGTTLAESLLGGHSAITAGDEQTVMVSLNSRLGRDTEVEGAYARNLESLSRDEVARLAGEYLRHFQPIVGNARHFTDKLPHNFMNIGLISLLFPNARIIHCRRHPMANCFSLYSNSMRKMHNNYKTDLSRLGLYYRQYARLMEHWRKVLPRPMHEVYYEDLVANTEYNARVMIDFLGLEWEDAVMKRSGSQRSVRTLSGWQVRQPIYTTSTDKWRLYERQLAPLLEAIGPHVDAYERQLAQLGPGDTGDAR